MRSTIQSAFLQSLSSADRDLISDVRARRLSYLSERKLASLLFTCRSAEIIKLPGIFIETGCALGGSAIAMALSKSKQRPFFVYDVFGMIPPPTSDDTQDVHDRYGNIVGGKSTGIGGDKYYGYRDDLYQTVESNLRSFGVDCAGENVTLVKGLIQTTLVINGPVAIAHVDVDWYEPVKICLERIFPNLVVGGSIILDDYHDWESCRKATDEFLSLRAGEFVLDDSARSMKITKIPTPG